MGGDIHESTTYILRDENNKILMASIEDKENLTSLDVLKSELDWLRIDSLRVEVAHKSEVGITSKFASEEYSLNKYGLKIKTDKFLDPTKKNIFKIEFSKGRLLKVHFKDFNNDKIILKKSSSEILNKTIVLEPKTLDNNAIYKIIVFLKVDDEIDGIYKKEFTIETVTPRERFVFNKEISQKDVVDEFGIKTKLAIKYR